MKINKFLLMVAVSLFAFSSCDDDKKDPGNPILEPLTTFTSAYFADSLAFSARVSDAKVPLSTLKAQLFFGDEMVSETVIRTKENGEYTDKIYVPFYQNIPDGDATLKLVLQNINFTIAEKAFTLPVSRPDYASIILVDSGGNEYTMARTAKNQYSVNGNFPQKLNAHIVAPAYGADGNEVTFGYQSSAIVEGVTNDIPFTNSVPGTYAVAFNTLTYAASPFVVVSINGTEMSNGGGSTSEVSLTLTQNQELALVGFGNISEWTLDPDFFSVEGSVVTFTELDGEYKITADFTARTITAESTVPPTDSKTINGEGMLLESATLSSIVLTLEQNSNVEFEDFEDFDNWWIDPSFFDGMGTGNTRRFRAVDGNYRIFANSARKSIYVWAVDDNGNAAKFQNDGSGAIWAIGTDIGYPSLTYEVGWEAGDGLCMARVEENKHQLVFKATDKGTNAAGGTINTEGINFKFFFLNAWNNGEFNSSALITTTSDIVDVNPDDGNLSLKGGVPLEAGATYIFTMDITPGATATAVLTVTKL